MLSSRSKQAPQDQFLELEVALTQHPVLARQYPESLNFQPPSAR
jgi:hypothetical protein